MTTKTQAQDLPRIMAGILIIGLLMGTAFWVVQPFLPAIIWSAMIVVASWPMMLKVEEKVGRRRWAAVLIMTMGLLLVIVIPLSVALTAVVGNIDAISLFSRNLMANGLPHHPEFIEKIPLVGAKLAEKWDHIAGFSRDEIFARLSPYIGRGFSWIFSQVGSAGRLMMHFTLTVIISALLYAHGEKAAAGVLRFARRIGAERGAEAVILAGRAVRAVALGVIVTALIQSALAAFGLLLAGVPYTLILSSLVFLLGVVQIGAGPILIGVIIWLFHSSGTVAGVLFVIWSAVVMLADNFIRPFLIKRGANIPLLIVFTGVIGGLISFGVVGLFIGPAVLAVCYTLIDAWIADQEPEGATADPTPVQS